MNSLLGLNTEQREAVEYVRGPSLIFAGAGSGKTKVLTHKVAYLIENRIVSPKHILAVTFTNKAADELRIRVERFVGEKVYLMHVGTFHSICARILRKEISKLNYSPHFTIYDKEDQLSLLKRVIDKNSIILDSVTPKSILSKISYLKTQMTAPEEFQPNPASLRDKHAKVLYPLYQNALRAAEALDFDDLLILPLEIFREFPEVLEKYRKRFQYILVDEYQDTNRPQFFLIEMLGREHKNVCVVGDDDQSIYSWRGADIENILRFDESFPECQIFKLEQNYRSTKNILSAASAVVINNLNRAEKTLWSESKDGDLLIRIDALDEYDEANLITSQIQAEIIDSKRNFKNFAILYRTNAQSRVLEEILRRNNIVYTIVGGVKFYERKEVKDVLAYLRVISNPNDDISLMRIINTPARGIGKSTQKALEKFAVLKNLSLYKAVSRVDFIELTPRFKQILQNFYQFLQKYRDLIKSISFDEWTRVMIDELGLRRLYKDSPDEQSRQRLANIDELMNDISFFCKDNKNATLENYLENVSLIADIDVWEDKRNVVSLMTLHSAKGLEFPVVFICGLNQGLFPLERYSNKKELEEERRLFYVGLTRAKEKVFLSSVQVRNVYGESVPSKISIFLNEIPDNLVRSIFPSNAVRARKTQRLSRISAGKEGSFPGKKEVKAGCLVSHKIFGPGKLIEIEGAGENARLRIMFKEVGKKTVVARFVTVL